MKNTIKIILILVCILAINACEDVLEIEPTDQISDLAVWNDKNLIKGYLTNIYGQLDHGVHQQMLDAVTDNATGMQDGGTHIVRASEITPSNLGFFQSAWNRSTWIWQKNYRTIREINNFIENIDDAPIDEESKRIMKGEAHYLRAYFHHNLWRIHGGIPIVAKTYSLGDIEGMIIPRNSYEETVNFLVQELETAADLLPAKASDGRNGRATKGAALALKSRILLYAASDLYHENPNGMAETGYTVAQNRQAFWRAVKNAAEDVMDLELYELYKADPSPGDSVAADYYRLFLTPVNGETIFEKYFTGTDRFGRNANFMPNQYHGPNGYHMWGGTTPTQQLVDAYRMRDGSKFDWDNPDHTAAIYENRDPRFYATVLYDGAKWRERSPAGIDRDRDGKIQTFVELTLPDGSVVPGLDTRLSGVDINSGSYSGYYPRKWLNEDMPIGTRQMPGIWIWIRYAEVLLNYAEASIELGEEDDARWAMNKIRRRAGMPEFGTDLTGQELIDEYRNERRIEFALEEHRFFDIRRWMIAPEVMNDDPQRIIISAEATDQADRSTYFNYQYAVGTYQAKRWENKMYFIPIIQAEMDRNHLLIQNPGF